MLVSILALALAAAPVSSPEPECKMVKVCKVKKPAPKPAPKPKKKAKTRIVKECCGQQQQQQVIIQITASEPRLVKPEPAPKKDAPFPVGIGLRGAVGTWSCNPYVFGLVGARLRFLPVHLGLEANTQFYWGHSVQAMVYPVQGPIAWHLDLGALWFYHHSFSAQDVPRRWDLALGTGIEVQIIPHLSFTADFRTTMPNPFDMNRLAFPDASGRHLNVGNVVGNSFLRSQLMVGLMVHTW